MLFLSLYKRLPCMVFCAFINLGEILKRFYTFYMQYILTRIKPVQRNGRLKLVTMEMQKLY